MKSLILFIAKASLSTLVLLLGFGAVQLELSRHAGSILEAAKQGMFVLVLAMSPWLLALERSNVARTSGVRRTAVLIAAFTGLLLFASVLAMHTLQIMIGDLDLPKACTGRRRLVCHSVNDLFAAGGRPLAALPSGILAVLLVGSVFWLLLKTRKPL